MSDEPVKSNNPNPPENTEMPEDLLEEISELKEKVDELEKNMQIVSQKKSDPK